MLKKILLGALTVTLLLSILTVSAFAAHGRRTYCADLDQSSSCSWCTQLVCPRASDADGDGICDNCGLLCGSGAAQKNRFCPDTDGDGLCDNCASVIAARRTADCHGGMHRHHGK